jgi:hypothetical protein
MKEETVANTMKELLADPANRIRLDDFVTEHIKKFLVETALENFPVEGVQPNTEEFLRRVARYQDASTDLQQIVILLGRWSDPEKLLLLEKIFRRLAEADKGSNGFKLWIGLGWYPILLLMYSGGIAALAAKKHDPLGVILDTPVPHGHEGKDYSIIVPTAAYMSDTADAWKWIPEHERKHTPRSEYLFDILREPLEDLLFLGKSYESLFDEFEVYFALAYADATERDWAPIGRFGWKHTRGYGVSPFDLVIAEGKAAGKEWPALKARMFKGSLDRFQKTAEAFGTRLNELQWF